MSKHHLRKDNTCQNCGHLVTNRFCPSCGQENIETRQSFGHLLRHFVEDITHYEGNFWKTIKYLLFRPAYLTKTYLAGKRMSYVAPVKLYIFVSFVAFFVPGLLPDVNSDHRKTVLKSAREEVDLLEDTTQLSSVKEEKDIKVATKDSIVSVSTIGNYASAEIYDSVQNSLPKEKRDGWIQSYIMRKMSNLNHLSQKEVVEKFAGNLSHNFPKALFVYLPLFAFVIWLFHGKKRWLYFDHAIFTLHYFSFILLLFTGFIILYNLIPWHFLINPSIIAIIFGIIIWFWCVYYFYRAHHKLYEESRIISWFKSGLLFFINFLLFIVVLLGFVMFTLFTIH